MSLARTADPEPHVLVVKEGGEGTWDGASLGDAAGEVTAKTASRPDTVLVNLASAGSISLLRWRPGGPSRAHPLPP